MTKSDTAEFTHIDQQGRLKMVDVSEKEPTWREARAEAFVSLSPRTLQLITGGEIPKGNVYEAARLAGIMAAKRTWELIPLCHPLQLTGIEVEFFPDAAANEIRISSRVKTNDRTGVEMEALVAVTHAALTIYDMCKAVDRGMTIREARLTFKSGGKSGTYERG
ncbi:MAG: cyclic pyranopterin monophosphate synthase MoaC [Desulfobacteraceae bacterium]|nr:cyclic pyranopterin monophosphate synthase MoaC [Desulfobacteraceae bacterium]